MIPIPLRDRTGYIVEFAWVDDEDFKRPEIGQKTWSLWRSPKWTDIHYAFRGFLSSGKPATTRLHRAVLGLRINDGLMVDHINGNGLDCRRTNLRIVSCSGNQQNKRQQSNNRSGYRGVHWDNARGKWWVGIKVDNHTKHLGRFTNLTDAVAEYDKAAASLHPYSTRRDKAA